MGAGLGGVGRFISVSYTHLVKEGDTFSFGKHTVTFVGAPMVHWPEAMVTLDAVSYTHLDVYKRQQQKKQRKAKQKMC